MVRGARRRVLAHRCAAPVVQRRRKPQRQLRVRAPGSVHGVPRRRRLHAADVRGARRVRPRVAHEVVGPHRARGGSRVGQREQRAAHGGRSVLGRARGPGRCLRVASSAGARAARSTPNAPGARRGGGSRATRQRDTRHSKRDERRPGCADQRDSALRQGRHCPVPHARLRCPVRPCSLHPGYYLEVVRTYCSIVGLHGLLPR